MSITKVQSKTNPKYLKHLSDSDPIMKDLIAKLVIPERKLRRNYFRSLARSIIGQQLSLRAAESIFKNVNTLSQSAYFPRPAEFLKIPTNKLRQAGLSPAKVQYIRNLSKFFINQKKKIKNISKMTDQELIIFLTQVKGIGRWTAEMFLIFSLGRDDIFSAGDLGLLNALRKLYKLPTKTNKADLIRSIEQISYKWRPYRSYASIYLWASLKNEKTPIKNADFKTSKKL